MTMTDQRMQQFVALLRGIEDAEIVRLLDAEGLTADPLIELLAQRLCTAEDRHFGRISELESEKEDLQTEVESLTEECDRLTEENDFLQENDNANQDADPQTHPGKVKAGRGGAYPDFIRQQLAARPMSRDRLLELAERQWPSCKKAIANAVARGIKGQWIVETKTGKLSLRR